MGVALPPGGKSPGTSQLGSLSLGGPGPYAVPLSLPSLSQASALPFIAHLYSTAGVFKESLGPLLNRPLLKWSLNAGHHPVELHLPSLSLGQNIVNNPSFEPSYSTGGFWAAYNNGPEAMTIADVTNGTALDKANFVRLSWVVPNTSTKGIYAAIGNYFAARKTYVVSFFARGTGGAVGTTVGLYWNQTPPLQPALLNPAMTGAWQRYAFRVTWGDVVDPNLFISILTGGGQAAGSYDIDGVQIEEGFALSPFISAGAPQLGDIVELTEQGGDGKVVYTGLINDILLNIDARPPYIALVLDPLVTELGEAFFDHNYTSYIDIAQMARDAVNATAHLTYTPQSIPDSGIFAKFNFHFTSALEVINTIKHIGGPTFWFYVDELGVTWFQAATLTGKPSLTLTAGSGFSVRKKSSPLNTLKNYIVIGGGLPDQTADGNALFAIYSNAVSQKKYGLRALTPPLFFPAAIDQATLNTIRDSIGAAMDQVRPKVQITLPAYGKRIVLGRHGGPTIRYWEPAVLPLTETSTGTDLSQSAGSYSPNYVILDVEMDGPTQTLVLGLLPVTADDFKYALDGTVARMTHQLMLYPPLSTNHYGIINLGTLGSS